MKRKNRNQTQTHSANLVTRFISQFAELGINQIKTAITNFISLFIFVIVLVFAVVYIGIPSLGSLFNSLSPWSQQKQEISAKNNVRDAYSSIIGSNVGVISQNGFISWFSSKEAKEIDISIPKLINYSPLFDDDSNRSKLKTAFENSINNDIISQSAGTYKIIYDGDLVGGWKNGKKISVFLAQFLGSLLYQEDLEITQKLTAKVLDEQKIDYYYPHPRVPLNPYQDKLKETRFCFEEEIYFLLEEYEFVEVHGFYSISLLMVKNIEGVSVHGYRTFLTTHESNVFAKRGVPYQNLSQSDTPVDIIMPVYNGAETISQTIDSVLNQTHQAFRLLIVDDGSTDNTEEVCKPYLVDERVQYIRESHKGISETLNRGVSLSQTAYVARQDADDIWMPWHLDLLLHELEENPQIDLIGARVIAEEDEMTDKMERNPKHGLSGEPLWLELAYRNVFNHSTVIFKRSAYDEAGGYDAKCDGFEDWHLWARMVTKENASVLNIVTTYYRLSERHKRGMAFRARLARSRGLRLEDVLD